MPLARAVVQSKLQPLLLAKGIKSFTVGFVNSQLLGINESDEILTKFECRVHILVRKESWKKQPGRIRSETSLIFQRVGSELGVSFSVFILTEFGTFKKVKGEVS